MKAADFLKEKLYWKPHAVKRYYFTHFNGTSLLLRINDLPNKPKYTFSYNVELLHLENLPKKWKIDQPS